MNAQVFRLLAEGGAAPQPFPWPPPDAEPLPPLPAPTNEQGTQLVWSRSVYRSTLPFTPPSQPDIAFPRSNFCGTRVADVPWMPGMGGTATQGCPTLVMDLDIWKYQPGAVDGFGRVLSQADSDRYIGAIFAQKQRDGDTHVGFYIENAAELHWSIPDTVGVITRWQRDFGGFADIWWCTSNVWSRRDMFWPELAPALEPWIEALLAAKAIDTHCLGLQLDGWLSGSALFSLVIGLGDRLGDAVKYFALHWISDGNAWWDDGTERDYHVSDRWSFWMFMRGLRWVNGQWLPTGRKYANRTNGQVDTEAPIIDWNGQGGSQNWASDVMHPLAGDQRFIPWEYKGQPAFDHPCAVPPWAQDMTGFLITCALGYHHEFDPDDASQACGGYGNGNRLPSGRRV